MAEQKWTEEQDMRAIDQVQELAFELGAPLFDVACDLQCKLNACVDALETMVSDDAFADLCEGIGEEPKWLAMARAALALAKGSL